MVNKGGFSWKRAVGITRAKQQISRATGIPLTRSGRQRKVGKLLTGGCVVIPGFVLLLCAISIMLFFLVGCGGLSSSSDANLMVTTSSAAAVTSDTLPVPTTALGQPETTVVPPTATTLKTAAATEPPTAITAKPTTTAKPTSTTVAPTTTTVAPDGGGTTVYITKTGEKYHRGTCGYLKQSKIPIDLSEAKNLGYEPCKVCKPPT